MDKPRKIILITIDSLRHDCFGHLKVGEFLKDYMSFENCYAAGVPTYLSMPALFQSVYASKSMKTIVLRQGIPTVAELLRKHGFATAGFADSNPFCSSVLGYDRGFMYFDDFLHEAGKVMLIKRLTTRNMRSAGRLLASSLNPPFPARNNTEAILRQALGFLRNNEGADLFLWMHLMDCHFPYRFSRNAGIGRKLREIAAVSRAAFVARKEKGRISRSKIELLKGMYAESIAVLGRKLMRFFTALPGGSDTHDVFITSDHGEEFYERGSFLHKKSVYEEITHVPLLVKPAGAGKPEKSAGMRSTLDIPATIADIAGIRKPGSFEGTSLFGRARSHVISECTRQQMIAFGRTIHGMMSKPLAEIGYIYAARSRNRAVVQGVGNCNAYDRVNDLGEQRPVDEYAEIGELKRVIKEHKSKTFLNKGVVEK